jgi:hypothetical protein
MIRLRACWATQSAGGLDPVEAANVTRRPKLSIYLPLIGLALAALAILAMAFGWV